MLGGGAEFGPRLPFSLLLLPTVEATCCPWNRADHWQLFQAETDACFHGRFKCIQIIKRRLGLASCSLSLQAPDPSELLPWLTTSDGCHVSREGRP